MDIKERSFQFNVPVEIMSKDEKGCRIRGVCSTEDRDLQGEVVKQHGLDFSYIEEGMGLFNWNHKNDPQHILGKIDKAEVNDDKTIVEGYLFPEVDNAKALMGIMGSLKPEDKGRIQMSIEGRIISRGGHDEKDIDAARIERVALTMDAVNPHTYAELVKSLVWRDSSCDEGGHDEKNITENLADSKDSGEVVHNEVRAKVEKAGEEGDFVKIEKKKFNELVDKVHKTMGVGYGGADAPGARSGGSAIATEDLEGAEHDTSFGGKKKKKKKASKADNKEEEKKEYDLKKLTKKSILCGEEGRSIFKSIVLRFKKNYPDVPLNDLMNMVYDYVESKIEG